MHRRCPDGPYRDSRRRPPSPASISDRKEGAPDNACGLEPQALLLSSSSDPRVCLLSPRRTRLAQIRHKPRRGARHDGRMTASAPRYDLRLIRAIRRLDDESLPIAEVWRRVGATAARIGVPRPSYVHVRRIVVSERERAAEQREIRNEALLGLVTRYDAGSGRARRAPSGGTRRRSTTPPPADTKVSRQRLWL